MIIISRVPSSLVDRTSDRTASSSITVPKFLIMSTSAAARPSICSMLVRRRSPTAGIVAVGDGGVGAQRLVDETHDRFSFSLGGPVFSASEVPAAPKAHGYLPGRARPLRPGA